MRGTWSMLALAGLAAGWVPDSPIVGQAGGGCCTVVAAAGNRVVTAVGTSLVVLDGASLGEMGRLPVAGVVHAVSPWDADTVLVSTSTALLVVSPHPAPVLVGSLELPALAAVRYGDVAIVKTRRGVASVDLTRPAQPRQLDAVEVDGDRGLAVIGATAYLGRADGGLDRVEVAEPASLRLAGAIASGLPEVTDLTSAGGRLLVIGSTELVVGTPGADQLAVEERIVVGASALRVTADAGHAAVIVGRVTGGYQVAWFTLGAGLVERAVLPVAAAWDAAFLPGTEGGSEPSALIVAEDNRLAAFDLRPGPFAHTLRRVSLDFPVEAGVAAGSWLVLGGPAGLRLIDTSDPGWPEESDRETLPVHALAIAGADVFAGNADGLARYAIEAGGRLAFIERFHPGGAVAALAGRPDLLVAGVGADVVTFAIDPGGGVTPAGRLTLTAPVTALDHSTGGQLAVGTEWGVALVDVSDSAAPRLVSELALPGAVVDVAMDGSWVIVAYAYGSGSTRLIDVTNPGAPRLLAPDWSRSSAVELAGGYAYSAGAHVRVIDIHHAAGPRSVAFLDGNADDLHLDAGRLVAVGDTNGSWIYDLTGSAGPALVARFRPYGPVTDLAMGDRGIAAATGGGLHVLSGSGEPRRAIALPGEVAGTAVTQDGHFLAVEVGAAPGPPGRLWVFDGDALEPLGSVDLPAPPTDIALAGATAFVTLATGYVASVELADPRAPAVSRVTAAPQSTVAVAASGEWVAVAAGPAGVVLYERRGAGELVEVARYVPSGPRAVDLAIAGEDVLAVMSDASFARLRILPDGRLEAVATLPTGEPAANAAGSGRSLYGTHVVDGRSWSAVRTRLVVSQAAALTYLTEVPGAPRALAAHALRVAVAADHVNLIDAANLRAPQIVATYEPDVFSPEHVEMTEGFLVAAGGAQLRYYARQALPALEPTRRVDLGGRVSTLHNGPGGLYAGVEHTLYALDAEGRVDVAHAMTGQVWRVTSDGDVLYVAVIEPGYSLPTYRLVALRRAGDALEPLGSLATDSVYGLAATAGVVYAATGGPLAIIDWRNPAEPSRVAGTSLGDKIEAVAVAEGWLIAMSPTKLFAFDISQPLAPRLAHAILLPQLGAAHSSRCCSLSTGGRVVAVGAGAVHEIAIDRDGPRVLRTTLLPGDGLDVAAAGRYAAVAGGSAGLTLLDLRGAQRLFLPRVQQAALP